MSYRPYPNRERALHQVARDFARPAVTTPTTFADALAYLGSSKFRKSMDRTNHQLANSLAAISRALPRATA